MLPNRTYNGLLGARLDAKNLREAALTHAQMSICRAKKANLQMNADKKLIYGVYKRTGGDLPRALEIFADNFYVLERALAAAERMDRLRLPTMLHGEHTGLPRTYDIAACIVGHRDGRLDEALIGRFISAYQEVTPLEMREIASLTDMLRAALIKLVSLECAEAMEDMKSRSEAEAAAQQLQKLRESGKRAALLQKLELSKNAVCAERLYALLSEQEARELCCEVAERLKLEDADIDGLFQRVRERQARLEERMENAIKSIRALDALDEERFFEEHSHTDALLRRDATYCRMDEKSRAYYRATVERLAHRLGAAETVIARQATVLALEGEGKAAEAGWYLFLEGRERLYASLRPDKRCKRQNEAGTLAAFVLTVAVITSPLIMLSAMGGAYAALLGVLPALSLAKCIAVRLFLNKRPVRVAPRIAAKNLDGDLKTILVIPALITEEKGLRGVMEQLETHMLSSRGVNCVYAVLGDFSDSKEPQKSGERELMRLGGELAEKLNDKYPSDVPLFYYLHRKKTFAEADCVFMGRERKRGALCDLVELITGKNEAPFAFISQALPAGLQYCVTLDADTVLPPNALGELVGCMEHPLNTPEISDGIVTAGYGVIAPRMTSLPSSAAKSRFARLVSGQVGLDGYFPTCAEFYQDVFGTGLFGGKGIFNIAAFRETAARWIPENTVLSHDLLEGCFLRTGFAGDITLFDGEPSSFIAWWKRQHRWTRGDWQLLPFIGGGLTDASGARRNNPLSAVSKLKIVDNLRRSLLQLSILPGVMLLPLANLGWYAALAFAALFEELICEILALPSRIAAVRDADVWGMIKDVRPAACRAALSLVELPYAAAKTADAVVRSLWRVCVSHRHILEWQTAAQTQGKPKTLAAYYRALWVEPLLGAEMAIFALLELAPVYSALLAALWLAAPAIMKYLDAPRREYRLNEAEREALMAAARGAWEFFSTFSTARTNFLPPDNFQQSPERPPARGTSPTNIGMALMAAVSAMELKIADEDAMRYIERVTETVERMEKWHGHLFNWYRTDTLEVLSPRYVSTVDSGNFAASAMTAAAALRARGMNGLAKRLDALAFACDFSALYDPERKLFRLGYDAEACEPSRSWYDLLASEARLTSLVAIAMGQAEPKHWFRLGRPMAPVQGQTLSAWSGTMFEYLMPLIFTGAAPDTLLFESCKNAVNAQRRAVSGRPWGVSESGYYAFDREMYYQYRAFGLQRLSLANRRDDDAVISPYSTMLALMVDKKAAVQNVAALCEEGAMGLYGMYEALDYTPSRLGEGHKLERVQSYMAHHQGMSICAIANCLCDGVLTRYFNDIPMIRSVRVLIEERMPPHGARVRSIQPAAERRGKNVVDRSRPRVVSKEYEVPEGQLLSNGGYTLYVTDSGLGFSQCGEVMLSRWRGDWLRGRGGVQAAVSAVGASYLVTEGATAMLHPHKAEFTRRGEVSSRYEVCVSARHDAELRRLTLTNTTCEEVRASVGVFMEVCLTTAARDAAHPGFNDLTTDAEMAGGTLILYKRRKEDRRFLYARLIGADALYMTDMLKAIGRGATLCEAVQRPLPPSGQENVSSPVLPCIFARADVAIPAGESAELWFVMGCAKSREEALESCEEMSAERREAFDLAWAHAHSTLGAAGVECGKAELFERIAARLLLNIPEKKKNAGHSLGLPALWKFGISGDAPIVLIEISSVTELRLLRTLIEFQSYYAQRLQACELVALGRYPAEYRNELQTRMREMAAGKNLRLIDGYAMTEEELDTLRGVAVIALDGSSSLNKRFAPRETSQTDMRRYAAQPLPPIEQERPELRFDNGLGGFAEGGEYVIAMEAGQRTPMPWTNVIANESFGTMVTESGGGHTWSGNSREHKLTPWYDAPVEDRAGEVLLLTDLDSGACFTPFAGRLQKGRVLIRHGYGYSSFQCGEDGLNVSLTVFVHAEKRVKISELTLNNPSMSTRRVSALYAVEWVLGDWPRPESIAARREGNIIFAKNQRNAGEEYGYIAIAGAEAESTGDRSEIFRGGWDRETLSEAEGYGASALRANIELQPGETRRLTFLLGCDSVEGAKEALSLNPAKELARVKALWRERVCGISVATPDEAMNTMMNGRLLYQTLSARVLARAGYYQCGGAVGFRDQLQDMLALIHTDPARVREHILMCAARQFEAGDVLHWWHMPYRGVRTRIVDDRLFLPYVLDRYVEITGDAEILEEAVPYLEDVPIPEGRRDVYCEMKSGELTESLYSHCVRAVESVGLGAHGLPLMCGGDWNDGMDLVGRGGGESVWLAWFYAETLSVMERMSGRIGKNGEKFALRRAEIMRTAEEAGWDGAWYRRAYFANGAPLGSRENAECCIDCVSQAWAAIAGGERASEALDSMLRLLYDEQEGILKLLSPPFDGESEPPVGYISDYLPGIRENGGQYTHAAAWAVLACCREGRGEQAMQLFSMLSPINHTLTRAQVMKYKTEPYAVAGDVYALKHAGRGGWTWYTGAAAWLYTVCLEEMLGIKRKGDMLTISPCVPFDEYTVRYPFGASTYILHIRQTADKKLCAHIKLEDDGKEHVIEVR